MNFLSFSVSEVPKFFDESSQNDQKIHLLALASRVSQKFEGLIDQKFYQIHLERQKIFNLVTNFVQISPSKAEVYQKL